METFASNIFNLSFKHLLHSYGFHIISAYKYEGCNFIFIFLLNNQLSFPQVIKNNMTHLIEVLLLNNQEARQCYIQKLNSWNVLFDLHQGIMTNEHEYVTKISQNLQWEAYKDISL
jgi:hypothetical protein